MAENVTAPGFQLKGSGWHATDFKGGGCAADTNSDTPPPCHGGISASSDDTVRVPDGYTASVLVPWGTPLFNGVTWQEDASNTAAAARVSCSSSA